jgi:hypothetical protein
VRDCSLRCASQMARTEGNCTRAAGTDISQLAHVSRTNMGLPSASIVGEPDIRCSLVVKLLAEMSCYQAAAGVAVGVGKAMASS